VTASWRSPSPTVAANNSNKSSPEILFLNLPSFELLYVHNEVKGSGDDERQQEEEEHRKKKSVVIIMKISLVRE